MAEIARRANVGMATLYRTFSGKLELLEAVYVDQVDAICAAAEVGADHTSSEAFEAWMSSSISADRTRRLERFVSFARNKRSIFVLLMVDSDLSNPVFDSSRDRVLAAGRPLSRRHKRTGLFTT